MALLPLHQVKWSKQKRASSPPHRCPPDPPAEFSPCCYSHPSTIRALRPVTSCLQHESAPAILSLSCTIPPPPRLFSGLLPTYCNFPHLQTKPNKHSWLHLPYSLPHIFAPLCSTALWKSCLYSSRCLSVHFSPQHSLIMKNCEHIYTEVEKVA